MFNSNTGYSLADIAAVTNGANSHCCNTGNGFGYGNGMWGDGWWIILLFILFLGGGWGRGGFGYGFGGNEGLGSPSGQGWATRADINEGFALQNLQNGISAIQNGICDSTYSLNNTMTNGFHGVDNAICQLGYQTQQGFNATNVALMQGQNALATQLANCCCDTRSAIQQANFDNITGQNVLSRQISDCCCDVQRSIDGINYNMATNTSAIQTSMANNTRDIIDNQNAGTRAILDYLCQEKISDLQNENQALRLAASQSNQNAVLMAAMDANQAELIRRLGRDCPQPSYLVPNPNCCYGNYGMNYGCSCA